MKGSAIVGQRPPKGAPVFSDIVILVVVTKRRLDFDIRLAAAIWQTAEVICTHSDWTYWVESMPVLDVE